MFSGTIALAKNFSRYTSKTLDEFVTQVYDVLTQHDGHYSEAYHRVTGAMMHYDWLTHYGHFEGVRRALMGLSQRKPFLGPLVACLPTLERRQHELETLFHEFYPVLLLRMRQWHQEVISESPNSFALHK